MPRSFALALLLTLLAAAPAAAADPRRAAQWNLDLIEADAARSVSTGAGATVAVIDSGVQADHPDLAGRIGPGYDVVQRDATPQDGDGHGTHVMGIVGAATGNGVGVESVAPGATLMPVRVLGDDGGGSIDDVARGIDWAREHGADVINLSLGERGAAAGRGRRRRLRRRDPARDRRRHRRRGRGGQQRRAGVRAARGARRAAVRRRGRQAPRSGRSSPRSAAGSGWWRRAGRARTADRHGGRRGRPLDLSGLDLPRARGHVAGRAARRRASPRCWSRAGVRGQAAVRRLLATATRPRRRRACDSQYGAGLGQRARGGGRAGRRRRAGRAAPGAPATAPVVASVRAREAAQARGAGSASGCGRRGGAVRVRVVAGRLVARGSRRVRAGRLRRSWRGDRHGRRGRGRSRRGCGSAAGRAAVAGRRSRCALTAAGERQRRLGRSGWFRPRGGFGRVWSLV